MRAEDHGLRPSQGRPAIPGDAPQSVVEVLDRWVAQAPDREALVGRGGRFSFAELDRAANRAARALQALGVSPGDRVAACLPNDVDIVVAFLGAMRARAIWVGVNRPLAPPEKAYLLRDSGSGVFLASREASGQIAEVRAELGTLAHVIEIEREAGVDQWTPLLEAQADGPLSRQGVDPFGPAAIAYTSGTTGWPKGAVHSQHNMLLPGVVNRATQRTPPQLRLGAVLPLTILNMIILAPLVTFQLGTCCVCMDRIDPEGLAQWIEAERVGTFCGVPTILHDLLTHPAVTPERLAPLEKLEVGGAEVPEEFRQLYRQRYGSGVTIGYGMTEAPTAVSWSDEEEAPQPGLCGTALPQVEVVICDEEGRRLPSGEVGEICVGPARSGPWAGVYTPMLGYWNRPEATAEVLREGLYHTGDLGLVDERGRIFIRGRRNELILRGGANVYPAEVERVIKQQPGVADCAVLGLPDERLGQRVVAALELEPGAKLEPDVLREKLRSELARYKVPEQIRVVEAFPRNAMSKVVKRELEPLFDADA